MRLSADNARDILGLIDEWSEEGDTSVRILDKLEKKLKTFIPRYNIICVPREGKRFRVGTYDTRQEAQERVVGARREQEAQMGVGNEYYFYYIEEVAGE